MPLSEQEQEQEHEHEQAIISGIEQEHEHEQGKLSSHHQRHCRLVILAKTIHVQSLHPLPRFYSQNDAEDESQGGRHAHEGALPLRVRDDDGDDHKRHCRLACDLVSISGIAA